MMQLPHPAATRQHRPSGSNEEAPPASTTTDTTPTTGAIFLRTSEGEAAQYNVSAQQLSITHLGDGSSLEIETGSALPFEHIATGYQRRDLAPGPWRVQIEKGGKSLFGSVTVVVGQTAEVTFDDIRRAQIDAAPPPHEDTPPPQCSGEHPELCVRPPTCGTVQIPGERTPRERACQGEQLTGPDGRVYVVTLSPDGSLYATPSKYGPRVRPRLSTGAKVAVATVVTLAVGLGAWWILRPSETPRDNPSRRGRRRARR